MEEKEIDKKLYKVVRKKGTHSVSSKQTDGAISSLQFNDDDSGLSGPVDLIEVNESELMLANKKRQFSPATQYALDEIVTPLIQRGLDIGATYFERLLEEKVIPATCLETLQK